MPVAPCLSVRLHLPTFRLPSLPVAFCRVTARSLTLLAWCSFRAALVGLVVISAIQPVVQAQAESVRSHGPIGSGADRWTTFVREASRRFAVPETWIQAVINAESAGDPTAVSSKGAMGLMQVMPQTWGELRQRYGLGWDAFDPLDNILAGTAYLKALHERYGVPGFLAAYHAGPSRYDDYLTSGRALPFETQAYLTILEPTLGSVRGRTQGPVGIPALSWAQSPVFVTPDARVLAVGRSSSQSPAPTSADSLTVEGQLLVQPGPDELFVRRPAAGLQR